eukprot:CAMPEP_0179691258 /NCGR_PEP_ID=MMETSP0936-20121108/4140_1 /TAXON_ID=548131 ORGANISM="Ostreococcus mediterraneus, Strain clade-D-RCC2573" /NCGR_SAMPLE_ID=MMETSP0936 /ASSEMBLY_ACC=CAM_ASM_000574 /LENGTH=31 /DNA_ID= /DNA_START= /DNA_END= /DNA_ORIENTATION=
MACARPSPSRARATTSSNGIARAITTDLPSS